jgi:predicted TIM-barrel fold metal-dependent hydrolase
MIIDTHLHCWELSSEKYPWNPLASVAPTYAWTVERELDVMDQYGIDKGLLVQPSMYRWDNRYNLFNGLQKYPDRFRMIGLVDPQAKNVEMVVRELAGEGVSGVRLAPMMRRDIPWYNDPKADRVWSCCGELGLTLLVIPEQVAGARAAIARFPENKIIVDHLARPDAATDPRQLEDLLTLAEFKNVFVKASALSFMSKEPYPHMDILAYLRRLFQAFGADRLMWGTDTPMSTKPETIPSQLKLIELGLPEASPKEIAMIQGNTAARLLAWNQN